MAQWIFIAVLVLSIAVAVWGGVRKYRQAKAARLLGTNDLVGVGGWLRFLAVTLGFDLIGKSTFAIQKGAIFTTAWSQNYGLRSFIVMTIFVFVLAAAFNLYVLICLFQKRRRFPQVILWYWLFNIVADPALILIGSANTGIPLSALWPDHRMLAYAVPVLVYAAWVWYAHTSVRVKNTMVVGSSVKEN